MLWHKPTSRANAEADRDTGSRLEAALISSRGFLAHDLPDEPNELHLECTTPRLLDLLRPLPRDVPRLDPLLLLPRPLGTSALPAQNPLVRPRLLPLVPLPQNLVLLLLRPPHQSLRIDRLDCLPLPRRQLGQRLRDPRLLRTLAVCSAELRRALKERRRVPRRECRGRVLGFGSGLDLLGGGGGLCASGGDARLAALETDFALGDFEGEAGREGEDLIDAFGVL